MATKRPKFNTLEVRKNDKFTVVEIQGTPFCAVHDNEKQTYFLAIGNKVIYTGEFDSIEEIFDIIDKKPYDLLINIACMCAEMMYTNLHNNNQNKNN